MIDFKLFFGESEESYLTIHAFLMGYCVYNIRKSNKNVCLNELFSKVEENCMDEIKSIAVCRKVLDKAGAAFCEASTNYNICSKKKFPTTSTSSTTSTTTTEIAEPAVTNPSFPIGSVLGGFLLGLLFSIVSSILIVCLCKKKNSSEDGLSTAEKGRKRKKSKKNKKTGTSTGSFETSGSFGTTSTGTTKTAKTKKPKKKKGKKGKKSKKSTSQTVTASAY